MGLCSAKAREKLEVKATSWGVGNFWLWKSFARESYWKLGKHL